MKKTEQPFGIFFLDANGKVNLQIGGFPGSKIANETGQAFPVEQPNHSK